MGVLDRFRGGENTEVKLRGQLNTAVWEGQRLQENLVRLEQQMNEAGWRQLASEIMKNFSRQGLDDMMNISRAMYLTNPLIQRACNVRSYYTWAQGVDINCEEQRIWDNVVEPLMEDPANKAEYFGHQARILTDIDQTVDGNLFFALFANAQGDVSIRSVPADEMREIHWAPGDHGITMFYERHWTERVPDGRGGLQDQQMKALYPDINYKPERMPQFWNGIQVFDRTPIVHQKTGGLKRMKFGVPETYAAIDWARAYKKFLEDWHTIVASLARFAWQKTTKGKKIKKAKEKLERSAGRRRELESEDDLSDRSGAGAVHISGEDDTMTPIPKSGATTSTDDAKPARLMVGAAMDLPDTILSGDPQQGNLATAKSLDRPTELGFVSRQKMWVDLDKQIIGYAITMKKQRDRKVGKGLDETVNVTFPSVVADDLGDKITAIVNAATLMGRAEAGTIPREELSRMLMHELGVEDIDQMLKDLDDDLKQKLADATKSLADALKDPANQGDPNAEEDPNADD